MGNRSNKKKLTLVLGSGFSKEAGLPTTSDIPDIFLLKPNQSRLPHELEDKISEILEKYWEKIFSYRQGIATPTLEDHFTLLDLAANSGHHLGKHFSPKKLRAIRRMSIHRVFQLLIENRTKNFIIEMLSKLNNSFTLSIITLNWDLVIERHLRRDGIPFHYPIENYKIMQKSAGEPWKHNGIPIMKMHGSLNWVYCDSCRKLFSGKTVAQAITRKTFLEADDFKLFDADNKLLGVLEENTEDRECPQCGNVMTGRVATFSYRKAFSIAQFQTIWERAHNSLSAAEVWLIIGYSMPEADFEFLHLLKSAELARKKPNKLTIEAVIGGREETKQRYKGFFGMKNKNIHADGLRKWVKEEMDEFIRMYSRK